MKRLFVSTVMMGALFLPAAAFAQTEGEAPAPAEAPAAAPEKAEEPEPEAPKAEEPAAEEPAAEEPAPTPVEPAPADPAPVETATTAATEEPTGEAVPVEAPPADPVEANLQAVEAGKSGAAAAAAGPGAAVVTDPVGASPNPAVTAEATGKTEPAGGVTVGDAKAADGKKKKDPEDTLAATMGVNAPVAAGGKPWQISASLSQSLGAGFLVAQEAQRDVLYGYSVSVAGSYKIIPLLDGRMDATGRFSFDQILTNSFVGGFGDSAPRQFNFRDIRLGVAGRGVIQNKPTGIIGGFATSIDLPTGPIARAEGRYFRWNLGINAFKAFSNVGPGTLSFSAAEIFRKAAGPAQTVLRSEADLGAICAQKTDAESAGCFNPRSPEDFGFIHVLNANYTVGSFNFGIGFALVNTFRYDYSESSIPDGGLNAGQDIGLDGIRDGVGATGTTHQAFTSASLSLGYVLNANINFGAGVSTLQEQFIQDSNGGQKLRFPWFDVDSTASSRTTFFLSANVLY